MDQADFSAEILMSFADGQLPEAQAKAVREAVLRDPGMAQQVEMFRASNRLLREAFNPVLIEPVPQRLSRSITALGGAPAPRRAVSGGWRRRVLQPALAAAITVLIGVIAGLRLAPTGAARSQTAGLIPEVAALPAAITAVLDRVPSGTRRELGLPAGAVGMLPLASYAEGGAACREFEVSNAATGQSVRGVACRAGTHWALSAIADANAGVASGEGYLPASGGADLAPRLGLKQPLSSQAEAQLIANGWR